MDIGIGLVIFIWLLAMAMATGDVLRDWEARTKNEYYVKCQIAAQEQLAKEQEQAFRDSQQQSHG